MSNKIYQSIMSNKMKRASALLILALVILDHNVWSVSYPTKIKDVVSKLTQITQLSLQNRNSRMEIELPPTAEYGVETTKKNDLLSLTDKIKKSNREAARLFTEMFSSISSTTTVLFPSEAEASTARSLWGATFRGKVLSIDSPAPKGYSKLRSRKFSFEEQQQALFGSDGIYIPEETEVLIISGPRSKDILKIKKITKKLTDATLIILLNSRAATSVTTATTTDFTITSKTSSTGGNNSTDTTDMSFYQWVNYNYVSVFNYAPPIYLTTTSSTASSSSTSNKNKEKEYLLYHEYNQKWYLAQKDVVDSNAEKAGGFLGGLAATLTGSGGSGFKTVWESPAAFSEPAIGSDSSGSVTSSGLYLRPSPSEIANIIKSLQ